MNNKPQSFFSALKLLLPLSMVFASLYLKAAPSAELWSFWQMSDESNTETIDHSAWQEILAEYIHSDESRLNLFDYRSASVSSVGELEGYLADMQALDPRDYSQAEQQAYWINLYNALTVELILQNYPLETITKLGKGFFKFGPWDDEVAQVAGEELTLNDIEHRILRPIWQDARIHFAVNCASLGCPNLQSMAFTAENTHKLMELAAFEYLGHARGAHFDSNGRLQLSSLFEWYADDFGTTESEVLSSLSHYAPNEIAERLMSYDGRINYEYDWGLNEL